MPLRKPRLVGRLRNEHRVDLREWKWPLVSLLLIAGSAAAVLSLLVGFFRFVS